MLDLFPTFGDAMYKWQCQEVPPELEEVGIRFIELRHATEWHASSINDCINYI